MRHYVEEHRCDRELSRDKYEQAAKCRRGSQPQFLGLAQVTREYAERRVYGKCV